MRKISPKFIVSFAMTVLLSVIGHSVCAGQVQDKAVTAVKRVVPPVIASATAVQRETWRVKMVHTAHTGNSCYEATYPDTTWHPTACSKPPKHYFGPKHGGIAATVGNGTDYVAAPTSPISLAEGSFDSVTGVTSESTINAIAGEGVNGANMFTLQLNSDFVTTNACNGFASTCQGFAQFVYDSSENSAYIQYWIINAGTCSGAWQSVPSVPGDCVQNAPSSVAGPTGGVTIADLGEMKLTGEAASGGSVTLYVGGYMKSAPGGNILPDFSSHWNEAEFNVFGDGGAGEAQFNNGGGGAAITVRTEVETPTNLAPNCVIAGWTGETNSLNLVSTPTIVPMAQYPSIVFDESSASTPQSCSTSVGDPHITTFDGLYYNFYASGDFVLANAGTDFQVQARQVSGAGVFSTPGVTMNTAVAVKMGTSQIAIYDSPVKVVLNGKTITLADNKITALPEGVSLYHLGSLYVITRTNGDLVRAQLYNGWMDLTVGLGHRARSSAKGILASPSGSALSMRDGTVLKEPVSTTDLYQRFAKSWVVQPSESLFLEHPVAFAAPATAFTTAQLDPQVRANAQKTCAAAGITDAAHLESCTLDTAVFKDPVAVKAFVHALPPKLVIRPVEATVLKQ